MALDEKSDEEGELAPPPPMRLRDAQWWRCHERGEDPASIIVGRVKQLRTRNGPIIDRWRRVSRAYGVDEQLFGKFATSAPVPMEYTGTHRDPTPILANIIDSLHADIYKSRLIPMPVTDNGEWDQQKRAEDLGEFLEGVCQEVDADYLGLRLGLFALLFGISFIKGEITSRERIGMCVVPPWEIDVDELESRYGTPRTWYHSYAIDRGVLYDHYGRDVPGYYGTAEERRRAIEDAPATRGEWYDVEAYTQADMIMVRQAWHLPSGANAKDGRAATAIEGTNGCLCDEEFTRELPPLRWLTTNAPLAGIRAESVAERLMPNQEYLNFLDMRIRDAVDQIGIPRIWIATGGQVNRAHINDETASIIQSITEPKVLNWDPIHETVLGVRQTVKTEMYELSGANQLQTNGALPPGLKDASGVALATFDDIHSQRHGIKYALKERFTVQLAHLIMDLAEELGEDGDYQVKLVKDDGDSYTRKLKWSEVQMDRDDLVLKVFPVSELSRVPTARFDQLQKMLDKGTISVQQFRRLWRMPDLRANDRLETAEYEVIEKSLYTIAFKGVYLSPESFDDLPMAMKLGRKMYNLMRVKDGFPAERLMLLMQFTEEAERENAKKAPPMPDPMTVGSPSPGGAPPMPGLPPGPMPAAA